MIHDDHRFTIYNYHAYHGDYKDYKDVRYLEGIPIDDPTFEKTIEYALKIRVFFNEHRKTSYTMYKKKNNYGRYFWQAEKRVNGKMRSMYIGLDLPDKAKLSEIAELFFLSDTDYYKYKRDKKTSNVKKSD